MDTGYYEILENSKVAEGIFKMVVKGDFNCKAGQFYMLKKEGSSVLLPRAISINDVSEEGITFLYHVAGKGTEEFSHMRPEDKIQLTGPLGNGFNLEELKGKKVGIVTGGIGIAPMVYVSKKIEGAAKVDFFAGFRDEVYYIDEVKKYVDEVKVSTESGSQGHKGFVTEIFNPEDYDVILCCGPEVMMRAVMAICNEKNTKIYVSLENKMACGIGGCLVCTCKTKDGNKRTCKDGPVFLGEELV